jgi:uncharacterized membrane protein YraQ (UPF0718 family)
MMFYLIFTHKQPPDLSFLAGSEMQSFKTLFLSIILEALPFVLLGVLVSALLQQFVSEQTIKRLIPKNPVLGVLFACLLGLVFPLCECGMIPVIRRLMRKGMPLYIAVVFILAGPIVNPVVYASTFMAFRSRPEIAYSRIGVALAAAAVIGLIIYRFINPNQLRQPAPLITHQISPSHNHASAKPAHKHAHHHDHGHHHDGHHHQHDAHSHSHGGSKVLAIFGHASDEFFEMGKYLIFGACVTALIQTFVARESLVSIGQNAMTSHLFMMGLAYVLSLCSTSDAFVASSFTTTFSAGSLVTFLVFGPMLDIKGTLMLLSAFRTRFVLTLIPITIVIVLACSLLLERLFLSA